MKSLLAFALAGVLLASGLWLLRTGQRRSGELPASASPQVGSVQSRENPGTPPGSDPAAKSSESAPPGNGLPVAAAPTNSAGKAGLPAPPAAAATGVRPPVKRPWDATWLSGLRDATDGDPIRFELPDGRTASGQIDHLERLSDEIRYVSGRVLQPEVGRFFFQRQTLHGVTGEFAGVVEFPAGRKAYRIEPSGPGGASEFVERSLDEVLCLNLPPAVPDPSNDPQDIPPLNPDEFPEVPIPMEQEGIVVLESLPGSTPVIYLDLRGGHTPTWGGVTYQRPNFDNAQIRDLWRRVAEDFLPFNINVTTDVRSFENAPENSRQRVIVTPTDQAAPGSGGVAYVGSFSWTGDTPCWVFTLESPRFCAQACSHEAGHALGLVHNGLEVNGTHVEYYSGHGSGETGWAPIMGLGYYQNVVQWSRGEYAHADNLQPQLAVIASRDNVHYRDDDAGATLATSRYLETHADGVADAQGVIETPGDADAFQFTTGGGDVSFRADPAAAGPNLALEIGLYDAGDTLLIRANPGSTLWAALSTYLPPGTYTIRVTGAGRRDPMVDGFSAYGSLGFYSITGSVANPRLPDRFVIPENLPAGSVVGAIPVRNPGGDQWAYTIISGNISNAFALDHSGVLTVANTATLNYESLARDTQHSLQFELLVNVSDLSDPSLSETNRRVVVGVTNLNEAPVVTGFEARIVGFLTGGSRVWGAGGEFWGEVFFLGSNGVYTSSVPEHAPPGTRVARIKSSDPDFYTVPSYSLLSGNSNGMFGIARDSGLITVVGDPVAAEQNRYDLAVVVSDETSPLPLTATSYVTVTVELPYPRGGISYAGYTNIEGTAVTALTNVAAFPHDPDWERQVGLFEADRDRADNYGVAMRGYLLPPTTGDYTFWITSQGDSELWLGSSTNPASMTRIAGVRLDDGWPEPGEWTRIPGQKSDPIPLRMGYAYYIEARLKAGTGTDHLAVAWESADTGVSREVIPGGYLAPYFMNYAPRPASFEVALHRDVFTGSRVATVAVSDLNPGDKPTFAVLSGNEEGLFSLDSVSGAIRFVGDSAILGADGSEFRLQVRATDDGEPPLSGDTTVVFRVVPTNEISASGIQQEIWTDVGGVGIGDLTNSAKFPQRPDAVRGLAGFDSGPEGFGRNYGSRIRALVTPPATGLFNFFLASDDESELRFSFDTDPSASRMIAFVPDATGYREWTRFTSQQSGSVWLIAGQPYYLEVRHKQIFLVDHVSVAWAGPGLSGTNVVSDAFLTPIDIEYPPSFTDGTVQLLISATNGTLVTKLAAADSAADALTYRIVAGNQGNTFALDPASGNLTVLDNTLITSGVKSNFNLAIQVQDSGYGGRYPLRTAQASWIVQIGDPTAPSYWTGRGTNGNWSTDGNWSAGAPDNSKKLSFVGVFQRTNYNDMLSSVGSVTFNSGGFYIEGNPLVLRGGLVSVSNNRWGINSTLGQGQTFFSQSGTLIVSATIDNRGHRLTLSGSGTVRFDGPISGAGDIYKADSGRLVLAAGNNYTGLTVVNWGVLALTNAGSMTASSGIEVRSGAVLDVRGAAGGFTVAAGQTLRGSGTVIGSVRVEGVLAAREFAAPAMTFSNALALAGITTASVRRGDQGGLMRVIGELELGGSLVVSNTSGPFAFGDSFKIFEAARVSGEFAIVQPHPGTGLQWDVSRLSVDGTLRVAAEPPRMELMSASGTAINVRFQTLKGLTYVVESAPSLEAPMTWSHVTTFAGTGLMRTVGVPAPSATPQQFLRVRAY